MASQDYESIKPVPDVKYPGLAFVTELTEPDSDFAQRLKVAFQTFVGLSNVDAVQKKGPPFELVSEQVEGVTLAKRALHGSQDRESRGDLARHAVQRQSCGCAGAASTSS